MNIEVILYLEASRVHPSGWKTKESNLPTW
jgi:hypothetical protein